MHYYRKPLAVESKADESPVTRADKEAEKRMRELISSEFPEHGIMGEEFGLHQPDAAWRWVLDPIDGTKSFIHGSFMFGTLIALLKDGEPVLGVINFPALKQFMIGDNKRTLLNGEPVAVRKTTQLSDATLLATDHLDMARHQNGAAFDKLAAQVKLYRSWGDCYGYYLLAGGYADIMIDPVMSPWDTMALIPVIQGAGGIITDYQGKSAASGNSVIAAHADLHGEVIRLLNP